MKIDIVRQRLRNQRLASSDFQTAVEVVGWLGAVQSIPDDQSSDWIEGLLRHYWPYTRHANGGDATVEDDLWDGPSDPPRRWNDSYFRLLASRTQAAGAAGVEAACAQLTCQMVAANTGIEANRIETIVEGDLDLRGTLGIDRKVSAGFDAIRLRFEIDAPDASDEDLEGLMARTERYCTVLQTLKRPPAIESVRA